MWCSDWPDDWLSQEMCRHAHIHSMIFLIFDQPPQKKHTHMLEYRGSVNVSYLQYFLDHLINHFPWIALLQSHCCVCQHLQLMATQPVRDPHLRKWRAGCVWVSYWLTKEHKLNTHAYTIHTTNTWPLVVIQFSLLILYSYIQCSQFQAKPIPSLSFPQVSSYPDEAV